MQTFLPYEDFTKSVECLDWQRLGKQRIETLQIIKALILPTYGWKNHPAVKMWDGCISYLQHYGIMCCGEWLLRGYDDSVSDQIASFGLPDKPNPPWWLGLNCFHLSHQSQLLKKDFRHYSKFAFEAMNYDEIPYVWPQAEPGFVKWQGLIFPVDYVEQEIERKNYVDSPK
jgi:hypothetical protein